MTIILDDGQLMTRVLKDIQEERARQLTKWGIQHRPQLITVPLKDYHHRKAEELLAKALCDFAERQGVQPGHTGGASWEHIINEELAEACLAQSKDERRAELVQCAAVIVAWIEDLDSH